MQPKPISAALAQFDNLPNAALIDVKTVAAVLGRSRSSIWRDLRFQRLPKPVKAGPGCTRWSVGAIRRHLASLGASS